jgi:hypothetical protein
MGNNIIKVYLFIGLLVLVFLSMGFYFFLKGTIPETPQLPGNPVFPAIFLSTTSPADASSTLINLPSSTFFSFLEEKTLSLVKNKPATPTIRIELVNKHLLIIWWGNLPYGTTHIELYRIKQGGNWDKWQTFSFGPEDEEGFAKISTAENLGEYAFYAEAVNDYGRVVWTSEDTPSTQFPQNPFSEAASSEQPTEEITPSSTLNSSLQPSSTTPAESPLSSSTPSQTPTSSSAIPPPSSTPSTTLYYYYRPDGTISYTYSPQLENFWVTHIDQAIEIGWQNLDESVTNVIIYRAASETGPWSQLLKHQYSSSMGPTAIRITDDSLNKPYYYKMEARSAGNAVVAAYGPKLLAP